jgi:hypothetical protein
MVSLLFLSPIAMLVPVALLPPLSVLLAIFYIYLEEYCVDLPATSAPGYSSSFEYDFEFYVFIFEKN